MTKQQPREVIEAMAETWVACRILLNHGHCIRRGIIVVRIIGINADGDSYRIVKVMPQLKSLKPEKYPAHYPRWDCLASQYNLHIDPHFIEQVKTLGLLRDGDKLVR